MENPRNKDLWHNESLCQGQRHLMLFEYGFHAIGATFSSVFCIFFFFFLFFFFFPFYLNFTQLLWRRWCMTLRWCCRPLCMEYCVVTASCTITRAFMMCACCSCWSWPQNQPSRPVCKQAGFTCEMPCRWLLGPLCSSSPSYTLSSGLRIKPSVISSIRQRANLILPSPGWSPGLPTTSRAGELWRGSMIFWFQVTPSCPFTSVPL